MFAGFKSRWTTRLDSDQVTRHVLAGDVLHDQVVEVPSLADIKDWNDVGMAGKGCGRTRLLLEASDDLRVLGQRLRQNLHRKDPAEAPVPGQENLRHATAADAPQHLIFVAQQAFQLSDLLFLISHRLPIIRFTQEIPGLPAALVGCDVTRTSTRPWCEDSIERRGIFASGRRKGS